MQRGDIWLAVTPGGDRPVLVLTRDRSPPESAPSSSPRSPARAAAWCPSSTAVVTTTASWPEWPRGFRRRAGFPVRCTARHRRRLSRALLAGSSIGGAHPKVLLDDGGRKLIAKLSQNSDPYPVVKAEGVAMALARRVGLNAAGTEVIRCLGRDVLLERFDRTPTPGERRVMVSSMTILGVDEWGAIHSGTGNSPTQRLSVVGPALKVLTARAHRAQMPSE